MVIAIGSYPIGRRFESHRRYKTACRRFAGGAFIPEAVRLSETTTAPRGLYRWPRGQAVKTSPFHGGNTSSILVGVTTKKERQKPLLFRGDPVSQEADGPQRGLFARVSGCAAILCRGSRRETAKRSEALPRGPLQGFRQIPGGRVRQSLCSPLANRAE